MSNSSLFDEKTFYQAFLRDLKRCKTEVIIESPFITSERMKTFQGIFEVLLKRGVKVSIITRNPTEHTNGYDVQSEEAIRWCEAVGVQVFMCLGNHHRKLAILDRKILWEGSLNILSQLNSREIMRRIDNKQLTEEMFIFLKYDTVL